VVAIAALSVTWAPATRGSRYSPRMPPQILDLALVIANTSWRKTPYRPNMDISISSSQSRLRKTPHCSFAHVMEALQIWVILLLCKTSLSTVASYLDLKMDGFGSFEVSDT
jgi:hypothetical protein